MLLAVRTGAKEFTPRKYNFDQTSDNFGVFPTSLLCSPVLLITTGNTVEMGKD